jgi:rhodanese-related sulfurtransferase
MQVGCGLPRLLAVLALIAALAGSGGAAHAYDPEDFVAVERMVARTFPDVRHTSTLDLERLVHAKAPLLLVDVREAAEFRVSRIPGAIRVDPGIWTRSLIAQIGEQARGRTVVLYCSVGVRSAKLAGRSQQALLDAGAESVVSMMGGIFRWHNELRALENDAGPTADVHPFDERWGRLISRRHLARQSPR